MSYTPRDEKQYESQAKQNVIKSIRNKMKRLGLTTEDIVNLNGLQPIGLQADGTEADSELQPMYCLSSPAFAFAMLCDVLIQSLYRFEDCSFCRDFLFNIKIIL